MRLTIFWGPALPGAVAPVPSDPVPFPAISAPPMGPSTGPSWAQGMSKWQKNGVGSFSWKFKKNNLCEGVQAIMTCNKKWLDGKRIEKVRSDK